MTNYIFNLIIPLVFTVLITRLILDWWLHAARKLGFQGKDMNKANEHYAVEAGGLWVVLASVFGILMYIAIDSYLDKQLDTIPLLSIALTLLLAGLLGFADDLLGWKKGISPVKRVLFTIPISLPLVAVKAGYSTIELPLFGVVDLGPLYSLAVVPIGVVGASNAFNMIAGYNGLEALQASILLFSVIVLALFRGWIDVIYVIIPVLASVIIFLLFYNKYPAKMFPGNSFTYGIGAFYASLAIYWNFEKYAIYTFTLYFLELLLFIRGLLNGVYKENFGKVTNNGYILPPYDKSYSVTHLAIKLNIKLRGGCSEVNVVELIAIIQSAICIVALTATLI